MEPENLRRSCGRVRAAAGLEGMRFHDMRHTCVSLLLHLGIAPNVVRDIVGHSDIEVTMTIYAHTSLDDKRAALRKLGGCVRLTSAHSRGPDSLSGPLGRPGRLVG